MRVTVFCGGWYPFRLTQIPSMVSCQAAPRARNVTLTKTLDPKLRGFQNKLWHKKKKRQSNYLLGKKTNKTRELGVTCPWAHTRHRVWTDPPQPAGSGPVLTSGILEMARCRGSLLIFMEKFALKAGSSKQGKAILAAVGSNWVDARTLSHGKWDKNWAWHTRNSKMGGFVQVYITLMDYTT